MGNAEDAVEQPVRHHPLPWVLQPVVFLSWLAIASIGLVFVFSATVDSAVLQASSFSFFTKQCLALLLGLIGMIIAVQIPGSWYIKNRDLMLFSAFFGMAMVLLFGVEVNGSTRWIRLGGFNLQVSEFARVAFLIYLSGYAFVHFEADKVSLKEQVVQATKPLVLVTLLVGLLLVAPDFGSAAMLLLTVLGVLFLIGLSWLLVSVLGLMAAFAFYILILIEPYRLERVTSFTDPWADPYGAGYQLIQALIALGRGGWTGQGMGESVQKLTYLPEAHTDFIFSIIVEETGLLGGLVVLGLVLFLASRFWKSGIQALAIQQKFHASYLIGLALMLGGQAVFNVLVNIGLLPTKGLTLPLISYGGSSVMAFSLAIGIGIRLQAELDLHMAKRHALNNGLATPNHG